MIRNIAVLGGGSAGLLAMVSAKRFRLTHRSTQRCCKLRSGPRDRFHANRLFARIEKAHRAAVEIEFDPAHDFLRGDEVEAAGEEGGREG